jgi:hypothetical protein
MPDGAFRDERILFSRILPAPGHSPARVNPAAGEWFFVSSCLLLVNYYSVQISSSELNYSLTSSEVILKDSKKRDTAQAEAT